MNSEFPLAFLAKTPEGECWQVSADCSSATGIHSPLPSPTCLVALSQGNSPRTLSEVL